MGDQQTTPPALRPHGFAGEHLVVLPGSVQAASARHPLLRALFVTDAGYFPEAAGHFIDRPRGVETAILIGCLRGAGWVRINERQRVIRAGEVVWIPARCPHAYGAQPGDPWSIEWVHLGGEEVKEWERRLGVGQLTVLQLGVDRLAAFALGAIFAALENGYSESDQLLAASTLRLALAELVRFRVFSGGGHPARERVAGTTVWMQRNLRRGLTLREMATAAGVSVPHYCSLFRQQTGYPPLEYFVRLRIQKACALLVTTTAKIELVAREVGYEDGSYFSRAFKKVMGVTPRMYRHRSAFLPQSGMGEEDVRRE